jgi:[histone H3]-lysine36 N-dimethyltransferase SETMAR
MDLSRDQLRVLLLYEFRLNHTATEAQRNICEAMGDSVISYHTAKNWFHRFSSGDYGLGDQPHSGPATRVDVDRLRTLIEQNPRLSLHELGEELGCSHTTVARHLHELGKTWKWGLWIPHELTTSQLRARVEACMNLATFKRNTQWLRNVVTGDEKWVLYVNHTRKRQWLGTGESGIPTAKPELHPKKVMLSVWWNVNGVVYWELLPANSTVNAQTYCEQLDRVAAKLHGKQDRVYFLHDNARPHIAKLTHRKLLELGWTTLVHPPYSPDLAPSDYHLFRSLNNHLMEKRFDDQTALESELASFFDSQPRAFYEKGIMSLPDRWQQVIDSNGMYIN